MNDDETRHNVRAAIHDLQTLGVGNLLQYIACAPCLAAGRLWCDHAPLEGTAPMSKENDRTSVVIGDDGNVYTLDGNGKIIPKDEDPLSFDQRMARVYADLGYQTRVVNGTAVALQLSGPGRVELLYTDHSDDGTSSVIWGLDDLDWLARTARQLLASVNDERIQT